MFSKISDPCISIHGSLILENIWTRFLGERLIGEYIQYLLTVYKKPV